jgi:hypothetical protein
MKKVPCLFQRPGLPRDPICVNVVTPGCEWVLAGEGRATHKWDGTACLVRDGKLFKRYDAKRGKTPPPGFEPCGEPDPVTQHNPGWLPVDVLNPDPADVWHALAWGQAGTLASGTYELCGPKLQSNPERFDRHLFMRHGEAAPPHYVPRQVVSFDWLRGYLEEVDIEGIVFHHPDGRMAKIRRHDFGFKWNGK